MGKKIFTLFKVSPNYLLITRENNSTVSPHIILLGSMYKETNFTID